jgi:hypothetical protein
MRVIESGVLRRMTARKREKREREEITGIKRICVMRSFVMCSFPQILLEL